MKTTHHVYDLVQKNIAGLFRDEFLDFCGINLPPIIESLNVEFQEQPILEERRADICFLLEGEILLHLEFQSKFKKEDVVRFLRYVLSLHERYPHRQIYMVIVFAAEAKVNPKNVELSLGNLWFRPLIVNMGDTSKYDAPKIFTSLQEKINKGEELTEKDMVSLVFLPLMKHNIIKRELALASFKMAKNIKNDRQRMTCISAIVGTAQKYLNETDFNLLEGVFRMTDVFDRILEEGFEKGIEKGIEEGERKKELELIKGMINAGLDNETIQRVASLPISEINQIRMQ